MYPSDHVRIEVRAEHAKRVDNAYLELESSGIFDFTDEALAGDLHDLLYANQNPHILVSKFLSLREAGLLSDPNITMRYFHQLAQLPFPDEPVNALFKLANERFFLDTGFDPKDIFEHLLQHRNPQGLASAYQNLLAEGLINQENIDIARSPGGYGKVALMTQLNHASLLNESTKTLIESVEDGLGLSWVVQAANDADLIISLSQIESIKDLNNLTEFGLTLINYKDDGLLTQDRLDKIIKNPDTLYDREDFSNESDRLKAELNAMRGDEDDIPSDELKSSP